MNPAFSAGVEAVSRDAQNKTVLDYKTVGLAGVRYDITGLTGGGATNLDGVATASNALKDNVTFDLLIDGTATRYRLRAGTDAEASPDIIRPDDFHASINARVWALIEIGGGGGGGSGDITAVTAGNGLTGGGSSGAVTLTVGAGSGITVNADDVAIDTAVVATDAEVAAGYQPLEATLTDIADGTIAENLVNTANPWADNEVSDTLTIGASGSVDDAAIPAGITRDAEAAAAYQPLDADLTDLADGTLTGSKVGTGINADNITSGTLAEARVHADLARDSEVAAGYQPLEATLTDIADGTIAENLVNTANPWADNEVSDTLTIGASGSVDDAAIPAGVTRDAEAAAAYQPLEVTLTDIADGTIAEDLVNTANPWADNEVSDTLTIGASGSVNDAAIPSGITRDAEAAAAYQPLDSDLTDLADGIISNEKVLQALDIWTNPETITDAYNGRLVTLNSADPESPTLPDGLATGFTITVWGLGDGIWTFAAETTLKDLEDEAISVAIGPGMLTTFVHEGSDIWRVLAAREMKSMGPLTIENPTPGDNITMFYTRRAITVRAIICVARGSSPSVTPDWRHGTDRSASGTALINSPSAVTSTTTGSYIVAFDDATVVAESFFWHTADAVSGTVAEFFEQVFYTED